jgi:hypothetical protein
MKKSLFTAFAVGLCMTANVFLPGQVMAQNNCNLIDSITLNVPQVSQTLLQGSVLRMTSSTFNSIDTNQWNYIVWVKTSANEGKIYKNGNLVFSGNFQNTNYLYNRLDLGAEFYTSYGNYFNGLIDEVRISNTERSLLEIQNYYNSNMPFIADANTVGLWHFDEGTGSITNGVIGAVGNITNGSWTTGVFGSCLNFNGINTSVSMNMSIPTSNMTVEFWIKPNGFPITGDYRPISLYGMNTTTFILSQATVPTNYVWSNGATGNTVTVDPTTLPYIWVTDGNCTDTIWFNSQSATIYDTTYISVTDTLIINTTLSLPAPNNENSILIYPNPASDHITIDYGNYAIMNGYQLRIENSLGQQVFQTAISQQSSYLDLSNWGGNGIYYIHIIDPQSNTIDIRKIVLQ